MPSLDLHCGQGHHRATVNVVEGDLLDARRDVVQAVVEERAPGVDDCRSRVRRQLEVLQLHRQGWQSQKQRGYQDKDSGN